MGVGMGMKLMRKMGINRREVWFNLWKWDEIGMGIKSWE